MSAINWGQGSQHFREHGKQAPADRFLREELPGMIGKIICSDEFLQFAGLWGSIASVIYWGSVFSESRMFLADSSFLHMMSFW